MKKGRRAERAEGARVGRVHQSSNITPNDDVLQTAAFG